MRRLDVQYLGRVAYAKGLDLQQQVWRQRLADEIPDTLLLLEHDSVFTMGRRDTWQDLLLPEEQLSAPVQRTDRGGEVTYHGPGQLVGYFHAKLNELGAVAGYPDTASRLDGRLMDRSQKENMGIGIKELVYGLEQSIIVLLRREYALEAWRDMRHRGVWLGKQEEASNFASAKKIAAVGISVKKGISMHGFALNVTTDLRFFDEIVPCGIVGRGVTSLACELETAENRSGEGFASALVGYLSGCFGDVFGYDKVVIDDSSKSTKSTI